MFTELKQDIKALFTPRGCPYHSSVASTLQCRTCGGAFWAHQERLERALRDEIAARYEQACGDVSRKLDDA